MIFVILILAIVSPAFTFPVTDQAQIKTEQQDSSYQVSVDSSVVPQEEKIEIQNPQLIEQTDKVQLIIKEANSNDEVEVGDQVQSTVDQEKPKIYLQPVQQISKVSDSVQKYSNVQLVQLEPVPSDVVLVSNLQQPILLPYITTSQVQSLSVIPVKQVNNINQSPVIPAKQVTNLLIIPGFGAIEERNIPIEISAPNQVPYAPSVQSSEVPQPRLNILQPSIGQVITESIVESQQQVQNTKVQSVNNPQTVQQNEKHVQVGVQAKEKQNIAEQSPVKSQVQVISTSQDANIVQPPVKVKDNNQPEAKGEHQVNQDQSAVSTQYDNAPQVSNEQVLPQEEVNPQIVPQVEEQPNPRQFDIKEEIQKLEAEAQQELSSSEPILEQDSQDHPYQEASQVQQVQEVKSI